MVFSLKVFMKNESVFIDYDRFCFRFQMPAVRNGFDTL